MLVCAFISARIAPVIAGAWPAGFNETQVIAAASFTDSNRTFDSKGKLVPVAAWRKFELGVNIETGVTDSLTLIAKPTFANIFAAGPPSGAWRGISSIEAGARVLLARPGDFVLSAQGLLKLPGARDRADPALAGMTAIEAEARVLAGYSFRLFERPAFADAQIGWRGRDGGDPGEARFDLTIGARPLDRVLLLAQAFAAATTGAGTASYPNQRWLKLQPSAVIDIAEGWSAQAGLFITVAAANARREQGGLVALWRRF